MILDNQLLTKPTGDPFTDVGGIVIKYFQKKYPEKNLLELIEVAIKIYVDKWNGKLNTFFLNSTITQPAFKGDRKKEETLKYFKNLFNEKIEFKEGYCRITGHKTKLFYAGRDNHILSGSGTFINFHHGFESGLYVAKEVILRIFFVPFGLLQLSDKIALIQSNKPEVTEYFVVQNCKANTQSLASGISEGILKSEFKNPANALFAFSDDCIYNLSIAKYNESVERSQIDDITLTLYHFTNFGASPDVQLYFVLATVFKFYATCLHPQLKTDWKSFIKHCYTNSKFRNAVFNEDTNTWTSGSKAADYEDYKVWRNRIYEKLLNGQSILSDILHWSINRKFNFQIVEYYQIYLRNMEQKTLNKIKELAGFITNKQDKDLVKKSISKLNGSKSSHDVRYFLLGLIDKNYREGNEKPIITLDDYVQYLFPDGTNWREVRDLLLIAIYQQLHENKINFEIELPEEETEPIND